MRVSYEESLLDGTQKVEWWDKEDFQGRVTRLYTAESAVALMRGEVVEPVETIEIPDDSIVCDFCNDKIDSFPVPVTFGRKALCRGCYERYFVLEGG